MIFYFNKEVSTDIDTQGIRVWIGAVNGDPSIREETSFHPNNVFVKDSTSVEIYIQSPVPVDGFGIQVTGTDA